MLFKTTNLSDVLGTDLTIIRLFPNVYKYELLMNLKGASSLELFITVRVKIQSSLYMIDLSMGGAFVLYESYLESSDDSL